MKQKFVPKPYDEAEKDILKIYRKFFENRENKIHKMGEQKNENGKFYN